MDQDSEKPEYKVGYKKPPVATRFKPGQSGNRHGRPKKSKNVSTIVGKEASSLVSIIEQGRRKMLSKIEISIKHLANKAASGDLKALLIFIEELRRFESTVDYRPEENATHFSPLTSEVAEKLYQEALKNAKPTE
jgi:hypothetical protein